jgi:hypothetical protein
MLDAKPEKRTSFWAKSTRRTDGKSPLFWPTPQPDMPMSDLMCTSYRKMGPDDDVPDVGSERKKPQFAQFFETDPAVGTCDPYQRLGIDRSMFPGEKVIISVLESLTTESKTTTGSVDSIVTTSFVFGSRHQDRMDSHEIDSRVEVEEFENVDLAGEHMNSRDERPELPSLDQMNSGTLSHIGESFVAHSNGRLPSDNQRRKNIAMAAVITSVVVVLLIIIIIGKRIRHFFLIFILEFQ